MTDKQAEEIIRRLRRELEELREQTHDIGELIREKIDPPFRLDLWELSDSELDQEMANRLSSLNEDINTRPTEQITSHRRLIGPVIVRVKKILRKILSPYTNLILERQVRFNEGLIQFHLASFIRFRQLDRKIAAIQERLETLEEEIDSPDHDRDNR